MFTIQDRIHLPIPVPTVWRLLADIERYQDWHPFLALSRDPSKPNKLSYTHVKNGKRHFTVEADLVTFEQQHEIAWRLGVRRILELEESFIVEKQERGTSLVHGMRGEGFGSFAITSRLRNGLQNTLIMTNAALLRHLKRATTIAHYSQQRR